MRKICALTANRADFSRIETILDAISMHPDLELQLVVLGSHLLEKTGYTINEIRRKGFEPNFTIQMEVDGGNPVSMTKSVGLAMVELATALNHLKPDVVLAPVDRFESLAMGSAAALMNIHVAHTQGGEVTGTIDESIRHALTKLSHLHFVSTKESKERVIKMGELPDTVFNVGCPGTDLLLKVPKLTKVETIAKINEQVIKGEHKLDINRPYFLMAQHPVTTEFDNSEEQIIETLEALEKFDTQIIVLWPNIDAGSDVMSKELRRYASNSRNMKRMVVLKHCPSELFASVLMNAECLIGNSSSGIREACYFGTPVVNVGSRQKGRERGSNVVDVTNDRDEIALAIRKQIEHGVYPVEQVYGDGNAGNAIASILATVILPNIQKRIAY
jgi:UDP-hydrolysing UDP-N-acetyl-D-glucosamine 2-epimerase